LGLLKAATSVSKDGGGDDAIAAAGGGDITAAAGGAAVAGAEVLALDDGPGKYVIEKSSRYTMLK
jgi:hypothetical protein